MLNAVMAIYNLPLIPKGYGMVYPVKTNKVISINGELYNSNTMHNIKISKMSQVKILAKRRQGYLLDLLQQ